MEKRIGSVIILINSKSNIDQLNQLLSQYGDLILSRLGLPLKEKGISIISLVVEGSNDQLGAMTGKIGRIDGLKVRSVLTDYKEEEIAQFIR